MANAISQGTDENKRIGREIRMKKFEFNGWLNTDGGSNLNNDAIRILIVYDKHANGTTATAADILVQPPTGYLSLSFPNTINSNRFIILWDKLVCTPGKSNSSTGGNDTNTYIHRASIDLDASAIYNGASTSPTSGAILLVAVGSRLGGSTAIWVLEGQVRLTYVDN